MIDSSQLKQKYLDFFAKQGHSVIPGASLVPENDPTVLFTTAGMHPLVPYLLGEKHPGGKRLVDVQKCIRTGDIEEVGDDVHLTFFEMLGNWSLGDYWKKEAIEWSFKFLTQELNIAPEKLAISCFGGEPQNNIPKDTESAEIWQALGISKKRIAFLDREENWWDPAGQTGPCGPDTEMFYWTDTKKAPQNFDPNDKHWVEIWNDVFMQYNKTSAGSYEPLNQKNVDTGMGVERTVAVLSGKTNVFAVEPLLSITSTITDLFNSSVDKLSPGQQRSVRIIADHLRAATFILAEGIEPSNLEKGYVLRRLIRRSVRYAKELGINDVFTFKVAQTVIESMAGDHPELKQNQDFITEQLIREEEKFQKAIEEGLKASEKMFNTKKPIARKIFVKIMQLEDKTNILHKIFEQRRLKKPYSLKGLGLTEKEFEAAAISGQEAFYLYQTFGLPIEMILELVREKNLFVSVSDFKAEVAQHQNLSRTATAGRFKGGLADHSEKATKFHTTTHLLLAALRQVLGDHVYQKGSNITEERLRLDFSHPEKLTPEQIKKVEDLVNEQIAKKLPVSYQEMSIDQAKNISAMGVFESKYGQQVKVYTVGDQQKPFSREICGGPHIQNTAELGKFKIKKEESSSSGVRRIKAILE